MKSVALHGYTVSNERVLRPSETTFWKHGIVVLPLTTIFG